MALMVGMALAIPATSAWSQMGPGSASTVSVTESANAMDHQLANRISQAWSEGKDASGAVAFQENGEIALSEGKPEEARQYFKAAERELNGLKPAPMGEPSTSAF